MTMFLKLTMGSLLFFCCLVVVFSLQCCCKKKKCKKVGGKRREEAMPKQEEKQKSAETKKDAAANGNKISKVPPTSSKAVETVKAKEGEKDKKNNSGEEKTAISAEHPFSTEDGNDSKMPSTLKSKATAFTPGTGETKTTTPTTTTPTTKLSLSKIGEQGGEKKVSAVLTALTEQEKILVKEAEEGRKFPLEEDIDENPDYDTLQYADKKDVFKTGFTSKGVRIEKEKPKTIKIKPGDSAYLGDPA
ncbi:unnamed protein product [Meloidogyne enterolobii]|uniref:Uncharacterized protein n=2 Tax=Meloidogyne enterolobii TaxID=390850 RepID=A0ACB0ZIJ4_MELEN|nr:unnamed protein product [Meloidogyne enterolobii]